MTHASPAADGLIWFEENLDLSALQDRAATWARQWSAWMPMSGSLYVGLKGDLGAGKTTFVQAFVRALPNGEAQHVASPTYGLVHVYGSVPPVHHLDLYRVGGITELEDLGVDELFESQGFILVEWPERAEPFAPDHRFDLEIRAVSAECRSLHLKSVGRHPIAEHMT